MKVLYKLYDRFHTWLYADSASPTTWHRATPEDRAKDTAPLTQSHEEWFADVCRRMGLVGAADVTEFIGAVEVYLGYPLLLSRMDVEGGRVYGACRPYDRKALIGIRHDIHPRMFLPTLCHEMAHLLRGHRGLFLRDEELKKPEDVEAEAIGAVIAAYLRAGGEGAAARFWKRMGG